mmetsp:Transcript_13414/g.30976  ORF Transcript_13414/g.30976 Transcript_13414/m.30976 type:complete len:161 (-) Transcript_13414:2532-3014(-)
MVFVLHRKSVQDEGTSAAYTEPNTHARTHTHTHMSVSNNPLHPVTPPPPPRTDQNGRHTLGLSATCFLLQWLGQPACLCRPFSLIDQFYRTRQPTSQSTSSHVSAKPLVATIDRPPRCSGTNTRTTLISRSNNTTETNPTYPKSKPTTSFRYQVATVAEE